MCSLHVFYCDGTIMEGWPVDIKHEMWGSPAVGDVDNDGDLEIVVNNLLNSVYVFHHKELEKPS